jgi:GTP-binding protein LepA
VLYLVDASQIETKHSNVYLALEQIEILPVINKIDLPAARPDDVSRDMEDLLGVPANNMPRISAKSGLASKPF